MLHGRWPFAVTLLRLAAFLAACSPRVARRTPAPPSDAPVKRAERSRPAGRLRGRRRSTRALRDAWKAQASTRRRAPTTRRSSGARMSISSARFPTAESTATFLASTEPDKRTKARRALLASPEYAEHWMNYWDDVLMGREVKGTVVDRVAVSLLASRALRGERAVGPHRARSRLGDRPERHRRARR